MVKPVKGFMTRFGRFFEKEEAAELSEAHEELYRAFSDVGTLNEVLKDEGDISVQGIIRVIAKHAERVKRFVMAVPVGNSSADTTSTENKGEEEIQPTGTTRKRNFKHVQSAEPTAL